jgi:membrane-bound serine protease (ClpP class)
VVSSKLGCAVLSSLLSVAILQSLFVFASPIAGFASQNPPVVQPAESTVVVVPIRSIILPGTEEQFNRGLALAVERKAAALVIQLDTPGGVLQTTQSMTQSIFKSPVPVIVYVSPTGGSATSAGVFITVAAHVAAMAPGTSIGAAHPVSGDGKDIEGDMRKKAENSTVAMARGLAQQRGRNSDWVERAVRESISVTAAEAVKEKVVDFEAATLADVLKLVKGRTVSVNGENRVLEDLSSATLVSVEPNTREAVINFLGHPNIAALLWLAATTGLSIELYNPGAVLPGVVGVISLVLALAVSQIIPLNEGAILLFVAGALMIGLEFIVPSFVLGIGGIIAMVAGALYLVDSNAVPGISVNSAIIIPTAVVLGSLMLLVVTVAARATKRRVSSGVEGMIGREIVLDKPLGRKGSLNIEGELWKAELEGYSGGEVPAGERVKVVKVTGLTVLVARA